MMKGAVSVLAWNMCYHRDKGLMGNSGEDGDMQGRLRYL